MSLYQPPTTPLPPLSPSPQLCYFLLCMEDAFSLWSLGKWWLHWSGEGVWWIVTFSQPQWAPCGLMQTFHWGKHVDLGCLPGCSAAMPKPPGHSPGWQAPTQARGVSLPSGCPCLCLSCVVASFSLAIAPPSPTRHPLSRRNALSDPGQALDSCGL